jgi:hypothetical protein
MFDPAAVRDLPAADTARTVRSLPHRTSEVIDMLSTPLDTKRHLTPDERVS